MRKYSIFIFLITLALAACAQNKKDKVPNDMEAKNNTSLQTATFGGGCFWCTEAQFQYLDGVVKVESGYSGGNVPDPTYEQVCEGNTGHAEVIQVTYDTTKISYDELLEAFWISHDPTQLNRQGNDVGTQYRSVIFYHNPEQKEKAEYYKNKLQNSGAYEKPVVTEIAPFTKFYVAEDYHQNYYNQNGSQPYCYFVIKPKLEKFKKVFKEHLKKQ
ncbi:peptide-methionine (S)-S-oxide reductase MsrA [Chitinophaga sp. sic0106]|uniref:peptide-methionine (S)-S-oxide reductase MsrA n=1 Tax=Chitinophaga sp. sic0106 TaxID=2854785 RepID=UPI001C453C61|nr:peptide-methionine (S)-S-oxide reductase MsrA [Chitinophaga sp. sic0106]MBV7529443.1 peptide-methionine (S)-S-oxide reductase MsrA [Chitinophaga sp. sic0106]